MTLPIAPTQDQVNASFRAFLLSIFTGMEIVQAKDNRVPTPLGPNYIVFNVGGRSRLSTNAVAPDPANNVQSIARSTRVMVQVDVYGPDADDNAQRLASLWRDDFACAWFFENGALLTPLYSDDPRNMGFLNDEHQIENRWSLDIAYQITPVVTVPQDFAEEVIINPELANEP